MYGGLIVMKKVGIAVISTAVILAQSVLLLTTSTTVLAFVLVLLKAVG